MFFRKLFFSSIFIFFVAVSSAQVDIIEPDLGIKTKISSDYFGPNALPVPDMLDGTVSPDFIFEFGGDYFDGYRDDKTYDIHVKVVLPLFSDRVNLTMWVQSIYEWYEMSEESHEHSRLPDDIEYVGYEAGDAYITTDIQILRQTAWIPDVTARVGLKTALGYGFFKARYFDSPGYFFDTSIAKSVPLGGDFFKELRFVGTIGFLCWQTDNGRQNDAIMYGVQTKLETKWFSLAESFGGYTGWEHDGDRPVTLKSQLRFKFGHYEPYLQHQCGFRDWAYHQYRIGFGYRF